MVNWRPRGLAYRVNLTPPATRTAGGIFLPEGDLWRANDGLVVGMGAGPSDRPGRYLPQARLGERVLFERIDLEPGPNEAEGLVADEDLVGILTGDEFGLEPCGEWLLVDLSGWKTETKQGLAVPDRYQVRERWGMVLAYGPGRLCRWGKRQGLRLTCGELLDDKPFCDVRGKLIYWGKRAALLKASGNADRFLIRCRDVIAVEEHDHGKDCPGRSVPAQPEREAFGHEGGD